MSSNHDDAEQRWDQLLAGGRVRPSPVDREPMLLRRDFAVPSVRRLQVNRPHVPTVPANASLLPQDCRDRSLTYPVQWNPQQVGSPSSSQRYHHTSYLSGPGYDAIMSHKYYPRSEQYMMSGSASHPRDPGHTRTHIFAMPYDRPTQLSRLLPPSAPVRMALANNSHQGGMLHHPDYPTAAYPVTRAMHPRIRLSCASSTPAREVLPTEMPAYHVPDHRFCSRRRDLVSAVPVTGPSSSLIPSSYSQAHSLSLPVPVPPFPTMAPVPWPRPPLSVAPVASSSHLYYQPKPTPSPTTLVDEAAGEVHTDIVDPNCKAVRGGREHERTSQHAPRDPTPSKWLYCDFEPPKTATTRKQQLRKPRKLRPPPKDGAAKRAREAKWVGAYKELVEYHRCHGDCRVPRGYLNSPGLASWVAEQRKQFKLLHTDKRSCITQKRIDMLNELGFAWDAHRAAWDGQLESLKEFIAEFGHTEVNLRERRHKKLAMWVKEQRRHFSLMNQGLPTHMTLERVKKLEDVGFCWDSHEAAFDVKLDELRAFKKFHDHCDVPSNWTTLGSWCQYQRRQYKEVLEGEVNALTDERIDILEKMGFKLTTKGQRRKRHELVVHDAETENGGSAKRIRFSP